MKMLPFLYVVLLVLSNTAGGSGEKASNVDESWAEVSVDGHEREYEPPIILTSTEHAAKATPTPRFVLRLIDELNAQMNDTSYHQVREIYLLPFNESHPLYDDGCARLIVWTFAAKKLFGSQDPDSFCYLEIGPNGVDSFNRHLKAIGVDVSYEPHLLVLYVPEVMGIARFNGPLGDVIEHCREIIDPVSIFQVEEALVNMGNQIPINGPGVSQLLALGAGSVPHILTLAKKFRDRALLIAALGELGPDARAGKRLILEELEKQRGSGTLLAAEALIKLHIEEDRAFSAIERHLSTSYAVRTLKRVDSSLPQLPRLLAKGLRLHPWYAIRIAVDRGVFSSPEFGEVFDEVSSTWSDQHFRLMISGISKVPSDVPVEMSLKSKNPNVQRRSFRALIASRNYDTLVLYLDYLNDNQICELGEWLSRSGGAAIAKARAIGEKFDLPLRSRLFLRRL